MYFLKYFFSFLGLCILAGGCTNKKASHTLYCATSADYPPFEYEKDGKLTGFDIELAEKIASLLGKKVVFKNMAFSGILPALSSDQADYCVSAFGKTEERAENFDFSKPYYQDTPSYSVLFRKDNPVKSKKDLEHRKIAVQLGTVEMPRWMEAQGAELVYIDLVTQSIESLKNGVVDGVMVEGCQGAIFCKENPNLQYITFKIPATANSGYRVVLKKDSPLTAQVNQAITELRRNGFLAELQKKWMTITP